MATRLRKTLAAVAACLTLAATIASGTPALASHGGPNPRIIDDGCGGDLYPLFHLDGPPQHWFTARDAGFNNCRMYTTTLDGNAGGPPVNIAWWYTYTGIDPARYANASAYQSGLTTCNAAFYNLRPFGEYTSDNYSYYVSQAGPNWAMVFQNVYIDPSLGAKVYLGDKQFCAAYSTLNVDGFQYYWPIH